MYRLFSDSYFFCELIPTILIIIIFFANLIESSSSPSHIEYWTYLLFHIKSSMNLLNRLLLSKYFIEALKKFYSAAPTAIPFDELNPSSCSAAIPSVQNETQVAAV